jgi:hypothetical protein
METSALTEKQKHWYDHLQRCADQSISLADYARQHDLDVNRLYRWKSVFARKTCNAALNVKSTTQTQAPFIRAVVRSASTIRVVFPNGLLIEFPNGIDETLLTHLARLRIAA